MKIRAKRQKGAEENLLSSAPFWRLHTAHGESYVRRVILRIQNILRMLGNSACENRLKATDFVCSHGASRRNNRLTLFRIIAEKGQGAKSLAGARGGSPASAA